MKIKQTLPLLVLSLTLSNCAFNYQAPIGNSKSVKALFRSNNIFNKTKRVLVIDGYNITYSDKAEGLLSTGYKIKDITPLHADCGKTMGLDYLKDNRTKTEIAFTVIIYKELIEIKSKIRAEYKPSGGVTQTINLTCISKGVLEEELLERING